MYTRILHSIAAICMAFALWPLHSAAQITQEAPVGRPEAIINLATAEGVRLVKGEWRYSNTKIIEVEHHNVGPDLTPSGAPNKTYDVVPHAGGTHFDDSHWEVLAPTTLDQRR